MASQLRLGRASRFPFKQHIGGINFQQKGQPWSMPKIFVFRVFENNPALSNDDQHDLSQFGSQSYTHIAPENQWLEDDSFPFGLVSVMVNLH